MNKSEAAKPLTPQQYRVLVEKGTDAPFSHPYTKEKRQGIYVDPLSGEVLFSSLDKFDSPCGWPAFSRPVDPNAIVTAADSSFGMEREEVLSDSSGGHLGHVFYGPGEGPKGVRYCINGSSLRFIPLEEMAAQGYGAYVTLFSK